MSELRRCTPRGRPHSSVPCVFQSELSDRCLSTEIWKKWSAKSLGRPFPSLSHPLAFALWQNGVPSDEARAFVARTHVGPEMHNISNIIKTMQRQASVMSQAAHGSNDCAQCRPGTNTWTWLDPVAYPVKCRKLKCSEVDMLSHGKLLCIGRNAKLAYRGRGEYIAISHVWAHGWQGVREEGICSRLLDVLCDLAASLGHHWLWIDCAMIGSDRVQRSQSINSMNQVYSWAAYTLICDRLLLGLHTSDPRELGIAVMICDWSSRVWTFQESLLSHNPILVTPEGLQSVSSLTDSLVRIDHASNDYSNIGLVRYLGSLSRSTIDDMFSRVKHGMLGRRTTKSVDHARALFPLFGLQWPGPDATLVEGQILLMQQIETLQQGMRSRLLGLFGPRGLPQPWSWAPLCFAGCYGDTSMHRNFLDGLIGPWTSIDIERIEPEPAKSSADLLSEGIFGQFFFESLSESYCARTGQHALSVEDAKRKIKETLAHLRHRGLRAYDAEHPAARAAFAASSYIDGWFISNIHFWFIGDFSRSTSCDTHKSFVANIIERLMDAKDLYPWPHTASSIGRSDTPEDFAGDLLRACMVAQSQTWRGDDSYGAELAKTVGAHYGLWKIILSGSERSLGGGGWSIRDLSVPVERKLPLSLILESGAYYSSTSQHAHLVEVLSDDRGFKQMQYLAAVQIEMTELGHEFEPNMMGMLV